MSVPDGLIDALYGKFLLRDVFGKVVPASVLVIIAANAVSENPQIVETTAAVPWFLWPIGYGLLWVVGFCIQSVPQVLNKTVTHNIETYPQPYLFVCALRTFREKTADTPTMREDRNFFERISVINEAAGITFWALIIGAIVWVVGRLYLIGSDASLTLESIRWGATILLAVAYSAFTFFIYKQHEYCLDQRMAFIAMINGTRYREIQSVTD